MRLVLAASALALAAAPHAAAPAPPAHAAAAAHTKPKPAIVIRAVIDSGDAQTAPAFVAAGDKKYITEFPKMLVVRVGGPLPKDEKKRKVRFRCMTPGCVLAPAENGEDVNRLDESAYDVDVLDAKASVQVSIQGDRPGRTYTVQAKPITVKGEKPVVARFFLTTR